MYSFNSTILAILAADSKKIKWLAETSGEYFCLFDTTYNSQAYDGRILEEDFAGPVLNRAKSEYGIQAPNDFSFCISNKDNEYSVDDFKTSGVFNSLTLRLIFDDNQIYVFTFSITRIDDFDEKLYIYCEDYLQQFLKGTWPNEPLVSSLSPSDVANTSNDLCVPVPFGTAYIPIRLISTGTYQYYVLGLTSAGTYTINEVSSPREYGADSTWTGTFTQSDQTLSGDTYRCFQALVTDGGYNVIFEHYSEIADILVEFERSDLSSTTDYSDALSYILQDYGIPSAMVDSASSFADAKTTYTSWGIEFNYGFYYYWEREELIAAILNSCNSTLMMTDKVELHPFDRTSRVTITSEDVSDFEAIDDITVSTDAAYIEFPEDGKPQDRLNKCVVVADGGSSWEEISSDTLSMPWMQNSVHAQRAGELWAQRKFYGGKKYQFNAKHDFLQYQPGDVITVNDDLLGGNYAAVIDSISVDIFGFPTVVIVRTDNTLEDWTDSTPSAITIAADSSSDTFYNVIAGPDATGASGSQPNVLRGAIRIETDSDTYVMIDPDGPYIDVYDDGNLYTRYGLVDTGEYGIAGYDSGGDTVFQISTTVANIAGWDFDTGKLSITGLELDADNNRIRAYTGSNYVDMTATGLTGYDSVLGTTFRIYTDGTAPFFSAGVVKECQIEMYTAGVIQTNTNVLSNGGLLINSTEMKGYNSSGLKLFQVAFDGTDEGDVYIGDYDNTNPGIKYDHSANAFHIRGNIYVENASTVRSDINVSDGADVTNTALQTGTTITGGGIVLNAGGAIRTYGKTGYDDANNGVYFGYDTGQYVIGLRKGTDSYFEFGTTDGFDIGLAAGEKISIKGDLDMLVGSDLYMRAESGDESKITFVLSSTNIILSSVYDDDAVALYASTGGNANFVVGDDGSFTGTNQFQGAGFFVDDMFYVKVGDTGYTAPYSFFSYQENYMGNSVINASYDGTIAIDLATNAYPVITIDADYGDYEAYNTIKSTTTYARSELAAYYSTSYALVQITATSTEQRVTINADILDLQGGLLSGTPANTTTPSSWIKCRKGATTGYIPFHNE